MPVAVSPNKVRNIMSLIRVIGKTLQMGTSQKTCPFPMY